MYNTPCSSVPFFHSGCRTAAKDNAAACNKCLRACWLLFRSFGGCLRPGFTLIRLEALSERPVSAAIPNPKKYSMVVLKSSPPDCKRATLQPGHEYAFAHRRPVILAPEWGTIIMIQRHGKIVKSWKSVIVQNRILAVEIMC